MITYHGTSEQNAKDIMNQGVNISKGGGELGQGFYVGDLLHRAAAWAWNKYGKDCSVLFINIDDSGFLKLNIEVLDRDQASELRRKLRRSSLQRSYTKGVDAIWAPVVGQRIPQFNQIKFEISGKAFVNSQKKSIWKTK